MPAIDSSTIFRQHDDTGVIVRLQSRRFALCLSETCPLGVKEGFWDHIKRLGKRTWVDGDDV
jgi:hypothetical protein